MRRCQQGFFDSYVATQVQPVGNTMSGSFIGFDKHRSKSSRPNRNGEKLKGKGYPPIGGQRGRYLEVIRWAHQMLLQLKRIRMKLWG
jgi:hypothetical protein